MTAESASGNEDWRLLARDAKMDRSLMIWIYGILYICSTEVMYAYPLHFIKRDLLFVDDSK